VVWGCAKLKYTAYSIHLLAPHIFPFLNFLNVHNEACPLNPRSCFHTVWHLTEKKKNHKKTGEQYQKEYFSKLNGLKPLNSSRIGFAVVSGETILS
jgi:hypothetical protein